MNFITMITLYIFTILKFNLNEIVILNFRNMNNQSNCYTITSLLIGAILIIPCLFSLTACDDAFGKYDNPVDPKSTNYQGYDASDTVHYVIFDANGGNGNMSRQAIIEGETWKLIKNSFTHASCPFIGWATNNKVLIAEYADGAGFTMGTDDVTLYAVWQGSLQMVSVAGGSFNMGSKDGDSDEEPVHEVTVNDFLIGKYAVTWREYEEVINKNVVWPPNSYRYENAPICLVSWYDAVAFCNVLSKKEGLENVYIINATNVTADFSRNGYRLPTEAEWEYAARGGVSSKAYIYSGSDDIDAVAWYEKNANLVLHTVGIKASNELGLYDMSGNAYEWCWDWYDSNYYADSPADNPTGPVSGSSRVRRGGSWFSYATTCRSTNRNSIAPSNSSSYMGFRVVRSL